jgi:hypothetical protein
MSEQSIYSPALLMRTPPAASPAPAAAPNLDAIIERLSSAIDEETRAIRSDVNFDIAGSNARKSRHLYDLSKAVRAHGGALPERYREPLSALRTLLERNEAAIRAHMNAVGEVAGLIQDAIRRSETDGTYSSGEFGRSSAP